VAAPSKPKTPFVIRHSNAERSEPVTAPAPVSAPVTDDDVPRRVAQEVGSVDIPESTVAPSAPVEASISIPESVPVEPPQSPSDESALRTEFERALSAAEHAGDDGSEMAIRLPETEPEERPTYPALCDTCGMEIRVPFQPDGSRPTFCKECFKNHQRTMARARDEKSQKASISRGPSKKPRFERQSATPYSRTTEARVYASADEPISLSRVSLVAPKKFKPLRERPNPDLGAVRDILKNRKPKR